NRLHDTLSSSHKNCLEIVILKKEDDVIPMLPKLIGERLLKIKKAYATLFKQVVVDYDKIKHIENQKEFALEAQKCIYTGPLFALRSKKVSSVEEFFENNINDSKLGNLLKILEKIDNEIML